MGSALGPGAASREEGAMGCPNCRRGRLVEISLVLSESKVTMHSCSRCDTRWWDRDGRRLPLGQVLDLAANK